MPRIYSHPEGGLRVLLHIIEPSIERLRKRKGRLGDLLAYADVRDLIEHRHEKPTDQQAQ